MPRRQMHGSFLFCSVVVVLLAVLATACSRSNDHPAEHSPGTIAGKVLVVTAGGSEEELPVTAIGDDVTLTGAPGYVRFRLKIRALRPADPNDPFAIPQAESYDVLVNAACFQAVDVGSPWPSAVKACR